MQVLKTLLGYLRYLITVNKFTLTLIVKIASRHCVVEYPSGWFLWFFFTNSFSCIVNVIFDWLAYKSLNNLKEKTVKYVKTTKTYFFERFSHFSIFWEFSWYFDEMFLIFWWKHAFAGIYCNFSAGIWLFCWLWIHFSVQNCLFLPQQLKSGKIYCIFVDYRYFPQMLNLPEIVSCSFK